MYPIKNRTHYGNDKECHIVAFSKPEQLIKLAKEKGAKVLGICDYASLSSAVNFIDGCEKENIKPIVSCEMSLAGHSAIFIAMNTNGWYNLIKLNSWFMDNEDIDMATFSAYKDDVAVVVHPSFEDDESLLSTLKYISPDNCFVEQNILEFDLDSVLPKLPVFDSRYTFERDVEDYKISLCCRYNKKFRDMKIEVDYCLESNYDKLSQYNENWEKLVSRIGDYKVLNKPKLPRFCEEDENEKMRELCREGWKKLIQGRVPKEKHKEYAERVKTELSVFEEANLAGYFLIVQDFVNYGKNKRILFGPARGSAGGCLVSYLLGITSIDPIPHGLMFSRFYNKGRNTGDHVEYPDIDIDVPKEYRKMIIDYIRDKYGHDRVAQVVTFSTLSGRGALKEVLRAHDVMDYKSIEKITKILPQEADISDKMSEGNYTSIIDFVLDNDPALVAEYCTRKDGKYYGELGEFFKQAARIEGTIKSTGKHAAGVVIGHTKLSDVYPMRKAKDSDEPIINVEMIALGKAGGVKFDILGVNALDKLMLGNKYLRVGNFTGGLV